jgi:hypothetical protein
MWPDVLHIDLAMLEPAARPEVPELTAVTT